jgi:hypothetical protein
MNRFQPIKQQACQAVFFAKSYDKQSYSGAKFGAKIFCKMIT